MRCNSRPHAIRTIEGFSFPFPFPGTANNYTNESMESSQYTCFVLEPPLCLCAPVVRFRIRRSSIPVDYCLLLCALPVRRSACHEGGCACAFRFVSITFVLSLN